jgi:hypothetical protein
MLSMDTQLELSQVLSRAGFDVRVDFPLGPQTTYAVGGKASLGVVVANIDTCGELADILSRYPSIPLVIVGRGSNTLVSDDGFSGVAVVVSSAPRDHGVQVDGDIVTAQGSMTMPILATCGRCWAWRLGMVCRNSWQRRWRCANERRRPWCRNV